METEKIIVDGKEIEVVVKLDEELKDDMILLNELEDTLDLENIISETKKIVVSKANE